MTRIQKIIAGIKDDLRKDTLAWIGVLFAFVGIGWFILAIQAHNPLFIIGMLFFATLATILFFAHVFKTQDYSGYVVAVVFALSSAFLWAVFHTFAFYPTIFFGSATKFIVFLAAMLILNLVLIYIMMGLVYFLTQSSYLRKHNHSYLAHMKFIPWLIATILTWPGALKQGHR